ncbi:hypothetical protein K2173_014865 [Erythroxylum novogranatense]|uniref:Root meristem growth factor 9 n=1 Tax=Erythroxylum novogranatense TaxID=1862640 RepID=A0AAV8THJ8_9ROSI|nr:hypothetical protein K2173_014865 [Erythroxylum novogranatense]
MAKVSCMDLLLVTFFLLCFVSNTVTARKLLKEADNHQVEKDQNEFQTSKGNERLPDPDELVGMDYTPARKKPPIHN